MSSKTTIFFDPTIVIFLNLWGSSQLRWILAIFPSENRRLTKTTSSIPFWM